MDETNGDTPRHSPSFVLNNHDTGHSHDGFTSEQCQQFNEWMETTEFKSIVTRERYVLRVCVLQAIAEGRTSTQIAAQGVCTKVFVNKTRQHYSLSNSGHLLYHARKDKPSLTVVPQDEVFHTVVYEHNAIHHQGVKKTWYEVSRRYHGIPRRAVDWVVHHCHLCDAQREGPRPAPTQPIHSDHVMERVQMDLIDMRMNADGRYRWILHIKDHYSRFCMLYPVRRRKKQEVLRYLLDWMALMGPPSILQTDNGREFANEAVAYVAQQHHIVIRRSQPGRPRSQGMVERANRHIRKMVVKWCRRFKRTDWAMCLSTIAMACNMSVHSTTNKTPYEVVFGRMPPIVRARNYSGPSTTPLSPPPSQPTCASPCSVEPTDSAYDAGLSVSYHKATSHSSAPPVAASPVKAKLWPRGSCVTVGLHGFPHMPLCDYRIPGLVVDYTAGIGYTIATQWGMITEAIPPRHVLLAPDESMPWVAQAKQYLDQPDTAPLLSLAECAEHFMSESASASQSMTTHLSHDTMQWLQEACELW